jgi:MobA-like NTP transferase domain
MSKVVAVILAAGQSRRFVEAGYKTPKPFLVIRDQDGTEGQMVNFVLNTLPPTVTALVAVPPDYTFMERENVRGVHIAHTRGQADTAYQVVRHLPKDRQVILLDCDMVLRYQDVRDLIALLELFETVTAVTNTFDPNASRVDQVPFPTRWVEKQPISSWGIVGARAFRNAGRLTEALKQVIEEPGEPYLSTAMNYYQSFGQNYAHEIFQFQDWGTPERIIASGAQIV